MKLLNLLGLVCLICFFLGEISSIYYFDLLSHFKLQYFLYLFLAGMVNFFAREKKYTAPFLFFSIIIFSMIGKSTSYSSLEKSDIKVLFFNVFFHNENYQGLSELIEKYDPDIVALVEADKKWLSSLESHKQFIFKKIEFQYFDSGIVILSKFNLKTLEKVSIEEGVSSVFYEADIEKSFKFGVAHLSSPINSSFRDLRDRQIERLGKMNTEIQTDFIVGDFNNTPWSNHFYKSFEQMKMINGLFPTWPSYLPPFLRIPLDHVFVADEIKADKLILKNIGSDHLPILVKLDM